MSMYVNGRKVSLYGTHGAEKVYESGKKDSYNEFWDTVQQNGNRTGYAYGFCSRSWNDSTFKPKYDIILVGDSRYVFRSSNFTDLIAILDGQGITLNTTNSADLTGLFYSADVTRVPALDLTNVTASASYLFVSCRSLQYVEKLIVDEDTSFSSNSSFSNCNALSHIIFEGTIATNGLNLQWSPLSHESIMSIINNLADKSSDTSGTKWIVTLGESNIAKLTEAEIEIALNKKWRLG